MKFLGLSAAALMLALPHAAAQDDASNPPAPDPSASVQTLTAPAEPAPAIGGSPSAGGGQRSALRTQMKQIDRAEREELRKLTEKYESDRRAIHEKYRDQRQPLEQEAAQLQQQTSGATQSGPTAAVSPAQKPGASVRHDEEWRRRERERRAREAEWRRRHPAVSGQSGAVKPGGTTAPAPTTTPAASR